MALLQDASPFRQGDIKLMISFPIAYQLSAQKAISYLQMIPLGTQAVITLHSCLISDVLGTYCFLPNVLSLILPHLLVEDFVKDLVYGNDVHLMFSSWFLGLIITLICT